MTEISENFIGVVEQLKTTINEISDDLRVNVQQAEEIQSLSERVMADAD
jgi:Mg2+ and Co2+ transporter CorA